MKLIAVDLDGTLLRSDGSVSERTVETLRRCAAAGMTILLASARPLRWIRPIAQRLGHTGFAVCSNGAVVYDAGTDTVISTDLLPSAMALDVVDAVGRAIPAPAFAVETVAGFGHEPGFEVHVFEMDGRPTVAPVAELITQDVIKLLVHHRSIGADQLLAATNETTDGLVEVTHSGGRGLLEISARGVTKASTLAKLAEQRGVAATDVVAFGDMPNDLPMLAWAGTSYAMANAHPDVLAAADYVAPSNDDDGVAIALSSLLQFGAPRV